MKADFFSVQRVISHDFSAVSDVDLGSYFPFYVQYYIMMALHTQFAQTAFGVQRRYHRLNLAIRNMFSLSE